MWVAPGSTCAGIWLANTPLAPITAYLTTHNNTFSMKSDTTPILFPKPHTQKMSRIKDTGYYYCLLWRESSCCSKFTKPPRLWFLFCSVFITSHYGNYSRQGLTASFKSTNENLTVLDVRLQVHPVTIPYFHFPLITHVTLLVLNVTNHTGDKLLEPVTSTIVRMYPLVQSLWPAPLFYRPHWKHKHYFSLHLN